MVRSTRGARLAYIAHARRGLGALAATYNSARTLGISTCIIEPAGRTPLRRRVHIKRESCSGLAVQGPVVATSERRARALRPRARPTPGYRAGDFGKSYRTVPGTKPVRIEAGCL
jgi:hypothetical protein